MGAHGPNFSGIHHFGFEVENLDEACEKLEAAQGQQLTAKDNLDTMMAAGSHRNFEMKWAGPDGVVVDVSHTRLGWRIAEVIPGSLSLRERGALSQRGPKRMGLAMYRYRSGGTPWQRF